MATLTKADLDKRDNWSRFVQYIVAGTPFTYEDNKNKKIVVGHQNRTEHRKFIKELKLIKRTKDLPSRLPVIKSKSDLNVDSIPLRKLHKTNDFAGGKKGIKALKMKPQDLPGIEFGKPLSVSVLAHQMKYGIESNKTYPQEYKDFMTALTVYWATKKKIRTDSEMKSLYTLCVETSPRGMNALTTDFSELLGACGCVSHNLLKVKIPTTSKIILPAAGNEPLVDYYIELPTSAGGELISVSAKSGSTSNTVKTSDIMNLIKKKGFEDRYNKTDEWKVMEILTKESVKTGPIELWNLAFPKYKLTEEEKDNLLKSIASPSAMAEKYDGDLLRKHVLLKLNPMQDKILKTVTFGSVWYTMERDSVRHFNKTLNFEEIFSVAVSGDVKYIKFSIGLSSIWGSFKQMSTQGVDINDIKLRAKNSSRRTSDRIGLQPK